MMMSVYVLEYVCLCVCVFVCTVVANSLRQYGTTSSVLTDPSRLSQEAMQAASQRLAVTRR